MKGRWGKIEWTKATPVLVSILCLFIHVFSNFEDEWTEGAILKAGKTAWTKTAPNSSPSGGQRG